MTRTAVDTYGHAARGPVRPQYAVERRRGVAQVLEAICARAAARELLATEADRFLAGDTINIVDGKQHVAPSGDTHNYISIAAYR
ncbi:MAG: hypothetical protein ACYDCO_06430 [Armatimonadota bacterium]